MRAQLVALPDLALPAHVWEESTNTEPRIQAMQQVRLAHGLAVIGAN